jgi:hypothetical protein
MQILASAPDSIWFTSSPADLDIEAEVPVGTTGKKSGVRKFSMVAYTGDPMHVRGYYEPIIIDLTGLDLGNSARPILIDHKEEMEFVLGQTDSIQVKGGKLIVSGNIYGESDTAKQVIALNDKGFKFQASIGARVTNREFVPIGAMGTVNGRTFNGPINIARKAVLGEVSFVLLGADDRTSASIAAHAAERKVMDFQQWLAAMGLSIDGLTDDQKNKLQAKFDAELKPAKKSEGDDASQGDEDAQPGKSGKRGKGAKKPAQVAASAGNGDDGSQSSPDDAEAAMADVRARRAEDLTRMNSLESIAEQYKGKVDKLSDLHATAIKDGWTADQFELKCLRDARPKAPVMAPGAIIRTDGGLTSEIIEAACCMTAKLNGVEKQYGEKVLETANKRFHGQLGLQEMLLEAAWSKGYTGRNFRSNAREVLQYAFRSDIEAAFSTIDISGILSNTANKFLLEGFSHVEQTWRRISTTRSVSDFKTITSYRMTGALQYQLVAPGGEIKHGTLGEESFTNAAKTYALILAVDRHDIVNDDLGAITTVPRKLGRGAGLKLNDIFWTVFLDNGSFFTAGNNNLVTTATYALSSAGLKKTVETFRKQTDADSKPLGAEPKLLLVPPELEVTADELFVSTNNNTGGAATTEKVPNRNVFAGKYQPIVSTYLSNASYTGYSATAYYLLGDPMDLAVIETCFLNGQQSPTIETADADFNVLGIQMRGYHDFGVTKQEHRAGVRTNGA